MQQLSKADGDKRSKMHPLRGVRFIFQDGAPVYPKEVVGSMKRFFLWIIGGTRGWSQGNTCETRHKYIHVGSTSTSMLMTVSQISPRLQPNRFANSEKGKTVKSASCCSSSETHLLQFETLRKPINQPQLLSRRRYKPKAGFHATMVLRRNLVIGA